MDNQQSIFKRLTELAEQASLQGRMTATPFLTPAEQKKASPFLLNRAIPFSFAGGYVQAERARCLFWADPSEAPDPADALAVSEVVPASPDLAHRDYLGSLLALGIRRDQLGDIIVRPDRAFVIHMPELNHFFVSQLERIGRFSASCHPTELVTLAEIEQNRTTRHTATVSSMRTDVMLGALFHCSRSQSLELIRRGLVQVDWTECQKPDQLVSAGQTITIRGSGRVRLLQCDEKSRKGKIRLVFERFK